MKFDGASKTASGYDTRNVRFNGMTNCYLGQVMDPKAYDGRAGNQPHGTSAASVAIRRARTAT